MNCPAISTQNDLRGFCMKYPTAPKKHFYTLIAFVLVMGPFVPWVQTFQDGKKYEGEWKLDKKEETGTLWVKRCNKFVKQYAGDWVAGIM